MSNSDKVFKLVSKIIESSMLTSRDVKKNISNSFKFQRDFLIEKFKLVPREEFEILKKIVKDHEKKIIKMSKGKKTKAAKKF